MGDSISMNHGIKIQILLETLRRECHYFFEASVARVCTRVSKRHESGRIAFLVAKCGGKIECCELSMCHILGELNGLEAWAPEEGATIHSEGEK